jgi:hypothetical protein
MYLLIAIPLAAYPWLIMTSVSILCIIIHNIALVIENKKLKKKPGEFAVYTQLNGFKLNVVTGKWSCVFDRMDITGNIVYYTIEELYKIYEKTVK